MNVSSFVKYLKDTFIDESLYGFSAVDESLKQKTGCNRCLVTLLPYPDLAYMYDPFEFYDMLENLRRGLAAKMNAVKAFLDLNNIKYAIPPASPKDDGNHLAEFSYKWAAIHAGLGFIGKNDVFVHYKYAQRVRMSCLLIDFDVPVYTGDIISRCGECGLCVKACPYHYITGRAWNIDIKREELVDYKNCAAKSKHSGEGQNYLCSFCALACTYPNI